MRSQHVRAFGLLVGLVAVLAVASIAAAAPLSDLQISRQIENRLSNDDVLENVTVSVQESVVRLSGTVPSLWAKTKAIAAAREFEDVTTVVSDALDIERAESDPRYRRADRERHLARCNPRPRAPAGGKAAGVARTDQAAARSADAHARRAELAPPERLHRGLRPIAPDRTWCRGSMCTTGLFHTGRQPTPSCSPSCHRASSGRRWLSSTASSAGRSRASTRRASVLATARTPRPATHWSLTRFIPGELHRAQRGMAHRSNPAGGRR